jgi:hypothetical protein
VEAFLARDGLVNVQLSSELPDDDEPTLLAFALGVRGAPRPASASVRRPADRASRKRARKRARASRKRNR